MTSLNMSNWTAGSRTCLHDFDERHKTVHVLASCHQTLQHQYLVVLEHVAAVTTHDLK